MKNKKFLYFVLVFIASLRFVNANLKVKAPIINHFDALALIFGSIVCAVFLINWIIKKLKEQNA